MALSVTHNKVATFADQPGVEINKAEWNDTHALAGFPGGGTTFLRDDNTFVNPGTNSGPTFPGGIPLTGVKYPAAYNMSVSTGDTDIYTCPAGKRAMFVGMTVFNASGVGNIVWFPEIKSGGTYFRLTSNVTTGNGAASPANPAIILEAGEIASLNTATNNGAVVMMEIIEFDNTVPLKTSKITTLAVGDNTVYTVPASTTALFMGTILNALPAGGGASIIGYVNSSGGARTVIGKIKPSGGAATQFAASQAPADAARTSITFAGGLGAGDQIILNTDANTATQLAWVNVMEIT